MRQVKSQRTLQNSHEQTVEGWDLEETVLQRSFWLKATSLCVTR